jgi:preprotein translocase subunit SecD
LTLAGIAGFILSVGMAVDANILIFERLREEIRSGKTIERALDDGFSRAWLSIRDSNVSSLITCLILYLYGTPAIKGFAVTLSIGILFSMFTAITITKLFLKLFITNKFFTKPWLFGVKMNK